MSAIRTGAGAMGLAFDLAGAAAWGLAAFFVFANLLSTAAGGLLGLGVFFSVLAYILGARLQESRARALVEGSCPRCRAALRNEHEHRRWDTQRLRWLAPLTSWECPACGYAHAEPAPCGKCPEAA